MEDPVPKCTLPLFMNPILSQPDDIPAEPNTIAHTAVEPHEHAGGTDEKDAEAEPNTVEDKGKLGTYNQPDLDLQNLFDGTPKDVEASNEPDHHKPLPPQTTPDVPPSEPACKAEEVPAQPHRFVERGEPGPSAWPS